MWIFTEQGWKQLHRPTINSIEEAPPRYRGPVPSYDCKSYIAGLERAHREWVERRAAIMSEG